MTLQDFKAKWGTKGPEMLLRHAGNAFIPGPPLSQNWKDGVLKTLQALARDITSVLEQE